MAVPGQLSLSRLNVKCRQNLEIRYYGANVVTSCFLDVHFVSPVPVECHARAGGHPVPMALVSWIPAFAGMTRGHKHWQCIYEMDSSAALGNDPASLAGQSAGI